MLIESGASEVPSTVNGWSRFLGVSLRPWSGVSPASLIVRGLIQLGISIFFIVVFARMPAALAENGTVAESSYLRGFIWLATAALVVVAAIALLRVIIGVIDLVPRRTVEGTVLSLTDRKVGDFLPRIAQRAVFERRESGLDQRRSRVELVLETPKGTHQWTVRSSKARKQLRVGARVRLSVTPLTGYVARVDQLNPQPGTQ